MTDLPDVKLKALLSFPATVIDGTGIDVSKTNGKYRFDIAFDDFAPPVGGITDAAHQNALLWNDLTGAYSLVSVGVIGTGGAVPEAPNDGVLYGRQSLDWTSIPFVDGSLNDTSSVVAGPVEFFQTDYFTNPAHGVTHRLNRILVGPATAASGNVEVTPDPGVWTEVYFERAVNQSQVSAVSAIGSLGVSGFARTSDYHTWTAGTSGGSQAVNGFALNDDLTVSTVPIACGVTGQVIHLSGCNGISLNQFDAENRGPVVDATPSGGVVSGSQYAIGLTSGLAGAVHNVTAALYVGANNANVFRKGVIFFNDALDTSVGLGGAGVALELASGQSQRWLSGEHTVTITIASPGVVSWAAHGLVEGTPIQFRVTGTTNPTNGILPTGITLGTTYYVKSPAANTFNVSATSGGAAINTSGSQSGTIKAYVTCAEVWGTSDGLHVAGNLGIGTLPYSPLIVGNSTDWSFTVNNWGLEQDTYSNDPSAASFTYYGKARGTIASTASVQNGDLLGGIAWIADDGTSPYPNCNNAVVNGEVDGAVSAGTVPMAITFSTGTVAPVERLHIASNGKVTLTSPVAITDATQVATKAYADTKAPLATISTSPPSGGVDGDVWYQVP